jgi:hypothetical protein
MNTMYQLKVALANIRRSREGGNPSSSPCNLLFI